MRALTQPAVLKNAGLAALATTVACLPRFYYWSPKPFGDHLGLFAFRAVAILWAAFFLWAFVIAWHRKYAKIKVVSFLLPFRLWGQVALAGLATAALLHHVADPITHQLWPELVPRTAGQLAAMALFSAAFEQLFIYLAPFAFFARLTRNVQIAVLLTVLFALFILLLKFLTLKTLPPAGAIFTLPALYSLQLHPHPVQTVFICLAGGVLGLLFLIPLPGWLMDSITQPLKILVSDITTWLLSAVGYPITQEFRERNPADGQVYTVQYFERARFEWHPEHAGTDYTLLACAIEY